MPVRESGANSVVKVMMVLTVKVMMVVMVKVMMGVDLALRQAAWPVE